MAVEVRLNDRLLGQARRGDPQAVAQLWQVSRTELSGLAAAPAADGDPERFVNRALAEARRRFHDFQGTSADQWRHWLETIAHDVASQSTGQLEETLQQPPAADDEATLIRPDLAGSDETVGLPPGRPLDETLDHRPSESSGRDDATLAYTPAARSTGAAPKPQKQRFGDYDLLEMIAKGGMGVVYKARQRKLNRVVAIKMILSGQFADQVEVDRFYAEAEAAANLRHPNIVAIHEVGELEGQHYFSMDYIPGKSLAELVRENPLPPQRAAQYVEKVAQAMEYAHQQGILHRDLKPSNILLDKSGEPLITDFGLAKRVESGSQLTMSGTILGTPSYMPPEQATGHGEVTVRSDVYSLGAILYELLSGRPPFRAASPFETVRQVIQTEPVALRMINPSVPRDLETICHKCLQKEPSARYESAVQLAEELKRYLGGEPILARPIGPVARFARWCRRNPVVAGLGASAVAFLVLALLATTIGYVKTSAALAVAEIEKQRSDESFRQAREAVDELFTRVSEEALLNQPGLQPLRQDLLQKALDYYQRFLAQRGDDAALRDELAGTLFRVGLITEEIESPAKALIVYQQAQATQESLLQAAGETAARLELLGNTLNAVGRVQHRMERLDAAAAAYRQALATRRKLAEHDPQNTEYHRQLASTHMNLGLTAKEQQRFDEARRQMQTAQQVRLQHLERGFDDLKLRRDLGMGYFNLAGLALETGEAAEAETNLVAAIESFEKVLEGDSRDLANQNRLSLCYRTLGDLQAYLQEYDQAQRNYQQARERLEFLAAANPDVPEYRDSLAGVYMNIGLLMQDQGKQSEALAAMNRAAEILEPLAEAHPRMPNYRRELAATLRAIGDAQAAAGDGDAARVSFERSRAALEALVKGFPDNADFAGQLKETQDRLEQLDTASEADPPPKSAPPPDAEPARPGP